jgi:DNA-binding response OmpR family regulator
MGLENSGCRVDVAYDSEDGLRLAEDHRYDALILERSMPGRSGLEICQRLRQEQNQVPILMLIGREPIENHFLRLKNGADDYLIKPFAVRELNARLQALVRRGASDQSRLLVISDLILDPETYSVRKGDVPIELTSKEYALLEFLMRNPNRVITRQMAQNHVWSYSYQGNSNVVDVYIRRLRYKIDEPFDIKLIETVHGRGYRLRAPVD